MKSLPFGKNKGKALERCEESYIKWLATHKAVLKPCNQPYADDAKQLLEKEVKPVNTQKVKIDWVEDGRMAVCLVGSYLPRVRKIDPAISQEIEEQFQSGQVVNISVDDEGYVRKVEAA